MLAIQILLVLGFILALSKVAARYRARALSLGVSILWAGLWLAAIVVVVRPNTTATLAKLAGIGRGADLVVYVALALIFYILFRLMVRTEELNRHLTKLTRTEALKDKEEKDKKV